MIVGVSHYIIRAPLYTYSMSSPTTTTTTTAKTTVAANNTSKDIFSKVLVAIDGSDPSMDAADYAIYISEKYNSELYALNVMRVDFDLFGPTETPKHIIEMKKQAQEYLDKVKLKANEKNIQIKTDIIASLNVAGGIVEYAENKNINLIVVSTRGISGFKKLLLGSIASGIVTYAHCPVLVVK
jgi:nucleotide-binding universal stress UspA family protein